MPTTPTTVASTYDSLLGAQARTDDPLASAMLAHAGFRKLFDDEQEAQLPEHMRGLHSLPYTASSYDLCRAASHAAEMLCAARFQVDLAPDPYVGPTTTCTDPRGTKFVGTALLDAVDLVAAANDIDGTHRALDQILGEDDGGLVRLTEFFRVAGEPLSARAADLDVAAALTEQLRERLAETADAIRPTEPPPFNGSAAPQMWTPHARGRQPAPAPQTPRPCRAGAARERRITASRPRPDVAPPKRH